MSEAPATEGGKKKGGKLPLIIAVVAVLAGGGYFMMGSKKKEPVKEPEPELGEVVAMVPEFVVNLRERQYFLRAEINLQLDKNSKLHLGGDGGGHGGGGPSAEMTALRDAVQQRLSSISVEDIRRPDFQERLRRLIAADANAVLHLVAHHEEEAPAKDEKKDKKSKKKKEEEESAEEHHESYTFANIPMNHEEMDYPEWDSDEGPVLKVYITSFATQRE